MYFHFLLSELPKDERDALIRQSKVRSCKRNEVLLTAGETSNFVYLVGSGLIRVVEVGGPDKDEVTTDFVRSGDIYLGASLEDNSYVASSTLVAALPSVIYQIPITVVREICLKSPDFSIKLLQMVMKRIGSLRGQLRRVSAMNAEDIVRRVLHELTQLAPAEGGGFDRRISQGVIASYTGLSRSMVNRTMKDMEDRGLLERVNDGVRVDPGFAFTDFGSLRPADSSEAAD